MSDVFTIFRRFPNFGSPNIKLFLESAIKLLETCSLLSFDEVPSVIYQQITGIEKTQNSPDQRGNIILVD